MFETQEDIKHLLNKIALKCLYLQDDWKLIKYEKRDVFYASFLINHITWNFLIKDFLRKSNSPFKHTISKSEFENNVILKRAHLYSNFVSISTNLDLKKLAVEDLAPLSETPSYLQKRLEVLFLTFLTYDVETDENNQLKSQSLDYDLEDVKNIIIIILHVTKGYINSNWLKYSKFYESLPSLEEYVNLTTDTSIETLFKDNPNFKLL